MVEDIDGDVDGAVDADVCDNVENDVGDENDEWEDDQGGDDQGGDSEARQATVVGVTTGAVFLLAAFWFQLAPAANNAAEGCDSLRRAVDAAAASGGVSEQHVALAAGPPADGGGAEAHEARL